MQVFNDRRDKIIEELGIKTGLQRTDSTMIGANIKKMTRLSLFHKVLSNLVKDLLKHGVVPNKSKIFKYPNLNNRKLDLAFLLGFFDGDGACSNFNKKKRFTPIVSVSQSAKEILEDINEILNERNLIFRLYRKTRKSYVWYVLKTKNKMQIKKYREEFGFLYPNKRKRLKVLVENI